MITVLIVDDSVTICAMLEQVLGREPGITLIGSAPDAAAARQMIARYRPDVITLDVAMPGIDGLHFLQEVHLRTHVVMLTGHPEAEAQSFEQGAFGFFDKNRVIADAKMLVKLVRRAAEGKVTRPRYATAH